MTDQDPYVEALTPREREVLTMVAQGLTNREIGAALFISASTAGVHVSNIMAKLGASSRTEAAGHAFRAGLVEGLPVTPVGADPASHEAHIAEPEPAFPTGWRHHLRAQLRRHPRSIAIVGGAVLVLAAVTTGLAFAVLTADRPTATVGASTGPTPNSTLVAGVTTPTPMPTSSRAASPSPSSSASPSSSPTATPSPSTSGTPGAARTASPSPRGGGTPTPVPTPIAAAATLGTWTSTGSLVEGRTAHTALLLDDGSVLVVGGGTNRFQCASVLERYNPTTRAWADETEVSGDRCPVTATLLDDGRVFMTIGGAPDLEAAPAGAAGLYDPETATWSAAAGMLLPRWFHPAMLLRDGTVLVAGGSAATITAAAEVYDPDTNTWIPVSDMADARFQHSATRLGDGSVLVTGGYSPDGRRPVHASAERFNPATRTWAAAGDMSTPRVGSTATLLPDGRVLVAGGEVGDGSPLASAELYDPATGRWSATSPMHVGRIGASASLLSDGRVLVIGGMVGVPSFDFTPTAEWFDPDTGRWTLDDSVAEGRTGHSATVLDNGVLLVVGGMGDDNRILKTSEQYSLRR